MRSLRIAYIFALTFLLSITVSLGILAFYKTPVAPQYPKPQPVLYSPDGVVQNDSNKLAQDLYDADYKEFQVKSQVHGRNKFIIALFSGVLLVLVGAGVSSISSAIATSLVLAGALTFTFGQLLLLGSNLSAVLARYTSTGRDVTGDLIVQFFVSLLGVATLLVIGFWKFRDRSFTVHHRREPIEHTPSSEILP